ncbi:MAG: bifunctional nuclease family protein [Chitinispirillales bacterium]|nr:bifunctional nuclease family protein [Chitinispirillales bacterium]
MLIQVEITSFAVDPNRSIPLIILRELAGNRSIAVPIGPLEASAIAMHSLQVQTDKPLTIDLVKITIEQLGASLLRAVISDVQEQQFTAVLQIQAGSSVKVIESRPCDAIGLALRCNCPIFVKDTVFAKVNSDDELSEQENLRKHIKSIDTVEFGRFVLE